MSTITINQYEKRHPILYTSGMAAAWVAEPYLKWALYHPICKKVISKNRDLQENSFLKYAQKAVKQNLPNDGFELVNLTGENINEVAQKYNININTNNQNPRLIDKFAKILLRKNKINVAKNFQDIADGKNAAYYPRLNAVFCNFEKMGSVLFHEIGHKMNEKTTNIFIRGAGIMKHPMAYYVSTITSLVAITTDPKNEKDSNKNPMNYIKSNCGTITFLGILPKTFEEVVASIKGNKIAQKSGLPEEMLKKVKSANRTSIFCYVYSALVSAIGVHLISKLRDLICIKKVKPNLT